MRGAAHLTAWTWLATSAAASQCVPKLLLLLLLLLLLCIRLATLLLLLMTAMRATGVWAGWCDTCGEKVRREQYTIRVQQLQLVYCSATDVSLYALPNCCAIRSAGDLLHVMHVIHTHAQGVDACAAATPDSLLLTCCM
jgi:hypothetical protein